MKKPSYEELLATSCMNEGLLIDGVGHFRSPTIKEVFNFGYNIYRNYLGLLMMGKEDFLKNTDIIPKRQLDIFEKAKDKLGLFDMMSTHFNNDPNKLNYVQLMGSALAFFLIDTEILKWDIANKKYLICKKDDEEIVVGEITKDNFDDVRGIILELNYRELENSETLKYKDGDKKAKMLWAVAQDKLRRLNSAKDDKSTHLGNIISKVCASGTGYTYHNVFDLTVFQLFDIFSQMAWLRMRNLSERIYSNHGDDKKKGNVFKYEDWLKNIFEK